MLMGGELLCPGMDHATISWILTSCFTWSLQALPTDHRSDCSHVQAACWSAVWAGRHPTSWSPSQRAEPARNAFAINPGLPHGCPDFAYPGLHSKWPAKEPQ